MGAVDQQNLGVNLLQQPSCSDVVDAVCGHVKGQDVLKFPYEVAGVSEGLDVIHVRFISWVKAGNNHEAVPVILLHHLEHAGNLLLDGGAQLEEVGAFPLHEEENVALRGKIMKMVSKPAAHKQATLIHTHTHQIQSVE